MFQSSNTRFDGAWLDDSDWYWIAMNRMRSAIHRPDAHGKLDLELQWGGGY